MAKSKVKTVKAMLQLPVIKAMPRLSPNPNTSAIFVCDMHVHVGNKTKTAACMDRTWRVPNIYLNWSQQVKDQGQCAFAPLPSTSMLVVVFCFTVDYGRSWAVVGDSAAAVQWHAGYSAATGAQPARQLSRCLQCNTFRGRVARQGTRSVL